MPETHFQEYWLFYKEQPFGLWREDYRTAQISHLLALINSDPKKFNLNVTDFMPFYPNSNSESKSDGSESFLANR